eukprot:COSAG05_NODE_1970_length_3768_cov_1.710548_4_plen_65_part_00
MLDMEMGMGMGGVKSRSSQQQAAEEKGGGSAYNVEYRLQVRDYSRSLVKLRRVRHVHFHIHVRL